ncbi:uncharacterized protein [Phyllobates terribilis]|uniref:uncharacterized protein n=1 Tax=Phyllobates terribilis TaxID=111132 RepID=UPI003CCACDD7
MTSNTFSYNAEEASSILAQANIPCDFLRVPPRETRGRDLEKEQRHLTNLELHCATITEYLRVQRIPRGLRVPLRPTLFSDLPDYCNRFEQILNKCSLDLMTLTVDFLHKAIASTRDQIKNTERQLTSSINAEEWSTLQAKINTNIDLHRKETEARKRLKFQRDTEDYELQRVYRWQEKHPASGNSRRYIHSSTDVSSSGSETDRRDQSFSSSRFLGQYKRRPSRRRREEAGSTRGGMDFTRITRSQTQRPWRYPCPLFLPSYPAPPPFPQWQRTPRSPGFHR